MLTLCALLIALPQVATERPSPSAGEPIRVALEPRVPTTGESLRWSPKGEKLALSAVDGALRGAIVLAGVERALRLERNEGAEHFDRLWLDLDADGAVDADEQLTCTPRETRGKWWSSFEATIPLVVPADGDRPATTRPYPVALWYVADPAAAEAEMVIRFSRRGWHQGEVEIDGASATVMITEQAMDGRFDASDAWRIARNPADALGASSRSLSRHDWLDGAAWRVTTIDPHGRFVEIARFDPGVTEAEERAAADTMAPDRNAPRAAAPLAFRHDVDAAIAEAKAKNLPMFLDFETTWCGPCKQMDALVYTSQPVVDAARGIVCVKVDGDDRRDLVERFGVSGYPTLLIVAPDGSVTRRRTGYQSVAATVTFLKGD